MAGNAARTPGYDGFVLDLDGTVYLSDRLIPGADRVIAALRGAGKRIVFVSNKPIDTREAYARKLTRLGVPTESEDVINSSLVLARYLGRLTPGAAAVVIGEKPLIDELAAAGIHVTEDPSVARWVVISFDRAFDYRKLRLAFEASRAGADLIATNPDRTCPFDGYELPDCAAMIGAVEGCTGRRVETIVGKPSPLIMDVALARLGLAPERCLMVGDRPETDVRMGLVAGMDAALVLTGVTRPGAVPVDPAPTHVLDSVVDLARFL
ncbi:MAG: HAD-IIA family hydrolase [Chloroflexota bacterium]